MLLHEKYQPQNLASCKIHKKKKDEFVNFMNDKVMKIAIIRGPPGCGKNAMIKAYCTENNIDLVKYSD